MLSAKSNPYEDTVALQYKNDYSNNQEEKLRKLRKRVGYAFFKKMQQFLCKQTNPRKKTQKSNEALA